MTLLKNLRVITLFYIEENKGADLVNALSYSEAKLYVFRRWWFMGSVETGKKSRRHLSKKA